MAEKQSAIVVTFNTHNEAEAAVKEIQKAGFEMKKLSIVGKDYHSDELVMGYYNMGDRVKNWGKFGAFWGGIWGLLFGSGFFFIPGMGPILVAGPLVSWIIGVLEGAAIVGGLSAVGAALFSIGIPQDSIVQYETSLKADKFLLIAHGSHDEVEQARMIVKETKALETIVHHNLELN